MVDALDPRQRKLRRKQALWTERASWFDHWREISQYQQPRAGRFLLSDTNQGKKRHHTIYDNTAIFASRTLASGLMSGMTSPARPWFRVSLADKDLMEFGPVKTWLHRTGQMMRDIFAASNTYNALHTGYEELGLFGTWANVLLPNFNNVVHNYALTVGEYAMSVDAEGHADTLAREMRMTVGQMVKSFGQAAVSTTVKNLFDRGAVDQWVDVVHIIEPREDRDWSKKDAKNMKFSSCYFEPAQTNWDRYLRESGFKRFPALCPRWAVTGNDIYGQSPGMECLGDVKQLQHQQLRKAQGIDYMTNPPIQVPGKYKEAAEARLPGGVFYVDTTGPNQGVRSAYDVNLRLDHLLSDIVDVRERIRSAYYADLFLMLANDTRSGVTATEVAERHEEKLLMLGPVLERLHNELLSPMIDLTFDYAAESGILPDPPEELQGLELNIEFISTLAQAQRAVAAGGMDRLIGTVSSMAALWPGVVDKIDPDQAIDDYGDMYGVNPEVVVPDERVAQIRADRAAEQQKAQSAAVAPQVVESAKTASEINTQGLQDVLQQFQGYSTGAPA